MPRQFQPKLPIPNTHGGRRKGAGRKNCTGHKAHLSRPKLDGRTPVHVTFKLVSGLPSLRRKDVFSCLRAAVFKAHTKGLRVVHYAVLANHVHLIVEPTAGHPRSPLQSLAISFSKRINSLLNRTGMVLHGRYDFHILKTPTEVRNALAYVLTNESKHLQTGRSEIYIDPFSSADRFMLWNKVLLENPVLIHRSSSVESIPISEAKTWLPRIGWLRAKRTGRNTRAPTSKKH